jgi:DNA primase catalytic core
LSYRTDGSERALVWIGQGCREFGILPGASFAAGDEDRARALMKGQDPNSGETLVRGKRAVYDDAKVSWAPLLRRIETLAFEADVSPEWFVARKGAPELAGDPSGKLHGKQATQAGRLLKQARRAVFSKGEAARVRADHAGMLSDWLCLDPGEIWAPGEYAEAAGNLWETVEEREPDTGKTVERRRPRRADVRNRGYDVTIEFPKSHSIVLAFADPDTAAAIETLLTEQVARTIGWLEATTCYGMAGHHGDGQTAQVVPGSGYAGWVMTHRGARPATGREVGDPHWHQHVNLANMARAAQPDRKGKRRWRTVAAGGRDLMRHAAGVDQVAKALVRRQLAERFGVEFTYHETNQAWEITGIPQATLERFSKRHADIEEMLSELGYDKTTARRVNEEIAEQNTRNPKTGAAAAADATLQQAWQAEERAAESDPEAIMATVFRRGHGETTSGVDTGPSSDPDGTAAAGGQAASTEPRESPGAALRDPESRGALVKRIAARLQDPDDGLTAHQRRFTRVDALYRVAACLPDGIADVDELEALTNEVTDQPGFVALPDRQSLAGPNGARQTLAASHMANAQTWTTADVVDDETEILRRARQSRPDQSEVRVEMETCAMGQSLAEAEQGFALSDEQAFALLRLSTEGRAVDALTGAHGSGKTTLMRALRITLNAAGYTVAGAATAAVAAQGLQASSGIPSVTVAQLLKRVDPDTGLPGTDVVVLDEANLTDDRDRAALYRAARASGTRIVEVGDPQQLRGIGCGSLFSHVLEEVSGYALLDNRRQQDEDDRQALVDWRAGRYAAALSNFGQRGQITATQTSAESITAMLAAWHADRAGAQDPHAQMRGLVMLSATNAATDRLNAGAQAMRAADGELGEGRAYHLAGGGQLTLHTGDHVMLRLNDRGHTHGVISGDGVLNGYRGLVTHIDPDTGNVTIEWERDDPDGRVAENATLSPDYVARGGVRLGYALTVFKEEGDTVGQQWRLPSGEPAGGQVLWHTPGSDVHGALVALSRHKRAVRIFSSVEETVRQGEDPPTLFKPEQRRAFVVERLAERYTAEAENGDELPVVAELSPHEFGQQNPGGRFWPEHDPDETSEADAADGETIEAEETAREAQPAPGGMPHPGSPDEQAHRAAAARAWRQAEARTAQNTADHHDGNDARSQARQDWALAVLTTAWGATHPSLVERLRSAAHFDRLAVALEQTQHDRGDLPTVLGGLNPDNLDRDDLHDPASYAASAVHKTAERADRTDERAAEREATADQVADLLHEVWPDHPELADAVVAGSAFPTVIQRLEAAHDAGADVYEVLFAVPVAPMAEQRIANPAAFTAFSIGQVTQQMTRAGQSLSAETAARQAERAHAYVSERRQAATHAHTEATADTRPGAETDPATEELKDRYADINAAAAAHYARQLDTNPAALDYLHGRLPNVDAARDTYALGYADPSWTGLTDHLRSLGYPDRDLIDAGVSSRTRDGTRVIDKFRDRLMIGFRDSEGRLAGFTGRYLGEDPTAPKYLNSPATELYDKSTILFGAHETREALAAGATPVVVEGTFDAMALAGTPGSDALAPIAPSGTAVTDAQLGMLRGLAGQHTDLIVGLDSDEAGQAANERAVQHARAAGFTPRVAALPDGQDPAEWVTSHAEPDEALAPYTDPAQTVSAATFLAQRAVEGYFSEHPPEHRDEVEGQLGAARAAAAALADVELHEASAAAYTTARTLDMDPLAMLDMLTTARPADPTRGLHPTEPRTDQPEPATQPAAGRNDTPQPRIEPEAAQVEPATREPAEPRAEPERAPREDQQPQAEPHQPEPEFSVEPQTPEAGGPQLGPLEGPVEEHRADLSFTEGEPTRQDEPEAQAAPQRDPQQRQPDQASNLPEVPTAALDTPQPQPESQPAVTKSETAQPEARTSPAEVTVDAHREPESEGAGEVPARDAGRGEPQPATDAAPEPVQSRAYGRLEDEELKQAIEYDEGLLTTQRHEATVARRQVEREAPAVEAGNGPKLVKLNEETTRLTRQAEAITELRTQQAERDQAVAQASQAGRERQAAEAQLADTGRFTRVRVRDSLVAQRDEARGREVAGYEHARDAHEAARARQAEAGPEKHHDLILTRARAAQVDYDTAREAAQLRDQRNLADSRADAVEREEASEHTEARLAALRGERDLRAGFTDAQADADAAARLDLRVRAGQQPGRAASGGLRYEPGYPQPDMQVEPPEPEELDMPGPEAEPPGPEPEP